ncbi:MAG: hypothetical protein ACP6IY_05950 [Promethearchaeia archaeon]
MLFYKKCNRRKDLIYIILNTARIIIGVIILYINLVILGFFLVYTIFLNLFFINYFLCRKCYYIFQDEFNEVYEYFKEYGEIFNKRQKQIFFLYLIDWFLPIIVNVIYFLDYIINLNPSPNEIYELTFYHKIISFIISIFIYLILIFLTLKRLNNKHCSKCLYKKYCPIAQNKWNIRKLEKKENCK